jgi:hypothetical protein
VNIPLVPANHFLEISPGFPFGNQRPSLPYRLVKIGRKTLEVASDSWREWPVLSAFGGNTSRTQ